MCGIAGITSLDGAPIDPRAIKAMADVLAHRGPDDAGYVYFHPDHRGPSGSWSCFADPEFRHRNEHLPVYGGAYWGDQTQREPCRLAIAHRRLSILDLTHLGHQPMATPDRRYWIVHNGEIYNFAELRAELESRGHRFRTRTDTEVILALWEDEGPRCLERLDGMFAFAIHDRHEGTLTLARDRFGVKPLYFARTNGHLVFASEIKALFRSGQLEAEIDPAGLVEYFTFQNVLRPETMWRHVQLLSPGHTLTLELGSGRCTSTQYHTGFPAFNATGDEADSALRVGDAFTEAVERQLVSDVSVGSFLSGGMDSGSIVAVAGRTIPRLLTFTAGFDLTNVNGIEQGFDERALAEQLSYLLQTEHYAVVLHAGDMPAAMERLTWHMDDPRAGMCHQNWYAMKLASKFVKVCLAGTGGDELFAGYPWRYRNGMRSSTTAEFDDAYFRSWHRFFAPETLPSLFAPDLRSYDAESRASFDAVMRTAPEWRPDASAPENLLQRALHFEMKTFLHGLLVVDDHVAMAHGLETRVPFLDNALADLAWSLPPAHKTRPETLLANGDSGHIDSAEGKRVLRRALARYLPRDFLHQQKQGFSPPDENWYRGPSMDYIKSILLDPRTLNRPWFDQSFVGQRLNDHFEGRHNHRLLIWSLLSIEWIQRHFTDGNQPPPAPPSVVPDSDAVPVVPVRPDRTGAPETVTLDAPR